MTQLLNKEPQTNKRCLLYQGYVTASITKHHESTGYYNGIFNKNYVHQLICCQQSLNADYLKHTIIIVVWQTDVISINQRSSLTNLIKPQMF